MIGSSLNPRYFNDFLKGTLVPSMTIRRPDLVRPRADKLIKSFVFLLGKVNFHQKKSCFFDIDSVFGKTRRKVGHLRSKIQIPLHFLQQMTSFQFCFLKNEINNRKQLFWFSLAQVETAVKLFSNHWIRHPNSWSCKSLMNGENSMGPKTKPCGTPAKTDNNAFMFMLLVVNYDFDESWNQSNGRTLKSLFII